MRRPWVVLAAALLIAAGAFAGAIALVSDDDRTARGDVARRVGKQLRLLERDSSLVIAVDMRYAQRNWRHVRALASRALREYAGLSSSRERLGVPPNLSGALNQLASFAGLSFDKDVRPLLDGYLVVGVTVPTRQPLPPHIVRLRRLLRGASYDPRRRAFVRAAPGGERAVVVRGPDGRPLTQADSERVLEAINQRDSMFQPRVVATYRTGRKGLRRVLEKALEGDRLKPLKGRAGASLLGPDTALVGGDTLVLATGRQDDESSDDRASPDLLRALDRADKDRGYPARRLGDAERSAGVADPVVLASGDVTLARLLVDEPNLQRARREVRWLRAIRSLAAAVAIDGSGLDGVLRVRTDPAQVSDADLPIGGPGRLELPQRGDAIVSGSHDQSVTTAFGLRLARTLFAGSEFVQAVDETERRLRIKFDDEFLRQFNCPSVSVFEPRTRRFGARSCVRDPRRMRALLPRLVPYLPKVVTGLHGLENRGLVTLLMIAPDAPLTPSALGALATVVAKPLAGQKRAPATEQLYELSGLRDPQSGLAQTGPERVIFGMIGDAFVVASDRDRARAAAQLKTRSQQPPAASAIRVPAAEFLSAPVSDTATKVARRLFEDLLVTIVGDRSRLTARAKLRTPR